MKATLVFLLLPIVSFSQLINNDTSTAFPSENYVTSVYNLTLYAAFEIAKRAFEISSDLDKNIAIAILDRSGNVLLMARADDVGPHNTEAARRKAFTAISTKTETLVLLRNAELNSDTRNLNTLPELLLLSGGVPILYHNQVIGSVGIAGGGSPEYDDLIAKSALLSDSKKLILKNK